MVYLEKHEMGLLSSYPIACSTVTSRGVSVSLLKQKHQVWMLLQDPLTLTVLEIPCSKATEIFEERSIAIDSDSNRLKNFSSKSWF